MFIKLRNLFSIFIFVFSLIQFSYSYLNISSCTTINEGFLDSDRLVLMNGSILSSSTSSCIEITANNLIFDCQNNLVEGDDIAQYGINLNVADAFSNITVQNCQVSNWDSSNIRVRGQNNSISNILSFNSKDYGIDLSFGDSTIIYNLTSINNNNSGVYFGEC